ncbi:CoA transferase subunit A [Acidaminobacter hydrogenoformans]|uniref:Acetate CoA/acetoacetate CoA-transferase alpha subunit n=1 Tax=Acidaminobacter hydrogenoformans DSM 2784 TaxID=1120920 RepID=A0A1G5RWV0_9FIRM|nr:3-oxoacid CoA-transferase subunit A [Acidaminobacter hydrogenoformans]SCZ78595.1 acetate CoA/acetoacetate CoA-transferase alpha subunit [Acidaminobacter hydrogenoformans DSM 2784]
MNKVVELQNAISSIRDGMTILYGGFMGVGTPEILVDALVEKGVRDLTVIGNDAAVPGVGIAKLISNGQVKKLIASHIGLNPEVAQLMNAGKLEVELVPQGTLVERIRCGGAGIGGFLTQTGLGTEVEKGKTIVQANGKDYLLELPIKADVALIRGSVADTIGNVFYRATTKNFNPLAATAAELVIVAAQEIVAPGELDPERVMTPCVYVDYVVGGEA